MKKQVDIGKVIQLIADYDLTAKCRKREKIYQRGTLFVWLRKHNFTFQFIGELVNRDHATILNGIKTHNEASVYPDFKHYVEQLKNDIEDCYICQSVLDGEILEIELRVLAARTIEDFRKIQFEIRKKIVDELRSTNT